MNDAMWAPLRCAALHAKGQPPSPELIDQVREHATARSLDVALRDTGQGFAPVDSVPGYVRKAVGTRSYYVPYGLAPVFPGDDALGQIDTLATGVRLAESSAICLSGSATFLGHITALTDLDFCEYYFDALDEARLQIQALTCGTTLPRLFRVKAVKRESGLPFEHLDALLQAIAPAPGATEFAQTKLDFVANLPLFGAIAATNMVLSTDLGAPVSPNASRSFPFQEIVIRQDGQLPHRNLVGPLEIGQYLNWLHDESRALTLAGSVSLPESGPKLVKGLKRALSWFLTVGEQGAVKDIIELLGSPAMAAISRAARADEFERLLGNLAVQDQAALRVAAEFSPAQTGLSHEDLVAVYEDIERVANALVKEMDMLRSEVGETIL